MRWIRRPWMGAIVGGAAAALALATDLVSSPHFDLFTLRYVLPLCVTGLLAMHLATHPFAWRCRKRSNWAIYLALAYVLGSAGWTAAEVVRELNLLFARPAHVDFGSDLSLGLRVGGFTAMALALARSCDELLGLRPSHLRFLFLAPCAFVFPTALVILLVQHHQGEFPTMTQVRYAFEFNSILGLCYALGTIAFRARQPASLPVSSPQPPSPPASPALQ